MLFRDRRDAGRKLSLKIYNSAQPDDTLLLALPRGGVPVAYEIARAMGAGLDIFIVRKLGTPGQPELAMGAVASGGFTVVNSDIVSGAGVPDAALDAAREQARQEIERQEKAYRGRRSPIAIEGRAVILVDDGIATGATMRAAIGAVRARQPRRITVATPVAPASTCQELAGEADLVLCLEQPEPFVAVGGWYTDFSQVSDDEVRDFLSELAGERTDPLLRR
jgi:putative phosphoribosyl transferase